MNYLTKFLTDLSGIWCAVETCWCDKPHTNFIKGETPVYMSLNKNPCNTGLHSDI